MPRCVVLVALGRIRFDLDSDSWLIRIWIHWQIEWSGFVMSVGQYDVVVVCLRCMVMLA